MLELDLAWSVLQCFEPSITLHVVRSNYLIVLFYYIIRLYFRVSSRKFERLMLVLSSWSCRYAYIWVWQDNFQGEITQTQMFHVCTSLQFWRKVLWVAASLDVPSNFWVIFPPHNKNSISSVAGFLLEVKLGMLWKHVIKKHSPWTKGDERWNGQHIKAKFWWQAMAGSDKVTYCSWCPSASNWTSSTGTMGKSTTWIAFGYNQEGGREWDILACTGCHSILCFSL